MRRSGGGMVSVARVPVKPVELLRIVSFRLSPSGPRFRRLSQRVIAGADCGFGTFAGYAKVDPDIAFKKLRSLVEGAEIATRRLWR